MSNILKPIGFVLILGAVGAGAYFLGQSSKESGGRQGATSPSVSQRVQNMFSTGGDSAAATNNNVAVSQTPVGPGPDTAAPLPPSPPPKPVVKPRVVGTTVPAQVTAISGDMVLTRAQVQVRLIGVRTPVKGPEVAQARADLAKLLDDGAVKLQFISDDHTTAYVWKDNRLLNESMIRLGWSRAGNPRFLTAEAAARDQGVGLWSPEGWMGVNP